jgi:hypothetical protein
VSSRGRHMKCTKYVLIVTVSASVRRETKTKNIYMRRCPRLRRRRLCTIVAPDVTSPDLDAMYVLHDELCKQKREEREKEKRRNDRPKRKVGRQFAPRFSILVLHHQSPGGVNVTKKKDQNTTNELHLAPSRMPTYATNMYKKRKKKRPLP